MKEIKRDVEIIRWKGTAWAQGFALNFLASELMNYGCEELEPVPIVCGMLAKIFAAVIAYILMKKVQNRAMELTDPQDSEAMKKARRVGRGLILIIVWGIFGLLIGSLYLVAVC